VPRFPAGRVIFDTLLPELPVCQFLLRLCPCRRLGTMLASALRGRDKESLRDAGNSGPMVPQDTAAMWARRPSASAGRPRTRAALHPSGDLRSHGTGWRSSRSAEVGKGCLELRPPR
jgi:hypothetical protein